MRKGEKTMKLIKKTNYKSSHVELTKESGVYKANLTGPNGEKFAETFKTELQATQWLVSKAEWLDRKAYDYRY